jgi:hypothetical protein
MLTRSDISFSVARETARSATEDKVNGLALFALAARMGYWQLACRISIFEFPCSQVVVGNGLPGRKSNASYGNYHPESLYIKLL